MRYLKRYKLFESNGDTLDTIEDMLLDLYDEGYKIRKSVKIGDNFYSWTKHSYTGESFEDLENGKDILFDGEFDQLQVNIIKNKDEYERLKSSMVNKLRQYAVNFDMLQIALDRSNNFNEFLLHYKSVFYRKLIVDDYQDKRDVVELAKVHPFASLTETSIFHKIPKKFFNGLGIKLDKESDEAYIEEIHTDTKKLVVGLYTYDGISGDIRNYGDVDRTGNRSIHGNEFLRYDISDLSGEFKSYLVNLLKLDIKKDIDKYKKIYEISLPLKGMTILDIDSIKDRLLEIIDYSESKGYDITLNFRNSERPFNKEILTQPGHEKHGFTYQNVNIIIHRNTVYETYKLFESNDSWDDIWDDVLFGYKIDTHVKQILSNPGWGRKDPSEEYWDIELVYQLSDDVYIDVIKLKDVNHLNYYLRSGNSFNYINQYDDNHTHLFKFTPYLGLSHYQVMMKICNYLLPYYQKKPSNESIEDIKECFIEIEDMASKTESDWGYCTHDEFGFFPAFRFSDKLCLCLFYLIDKEIVFDDVKKEFEDVKSRLELHDIHPSRAEIKEDGNWFHDQKYRCVIQISF